MTIFELLCCAAKYLYEDRKGYYFNIILKVILMNSRNVVISIPLFTIF